MQEEANDVHEETKRCTNKKRRSRGEEMEGRDGFKILT